MFLLRKLNAEETQRERSKRNYSSLRSLCERTKMKNTFKCCVCAVRARQRRSDIPIFLDSERSLCMRNQLIVTANMCVAWARQRRSRVVVLSWWQPISLFTVCLSECRNTVRTLCMLKLGAVSCRSRRSHSDKWRCCCIVAALCELYELLLLAVWCFTFLKERSRTALRTHLV